MSASGVSLSWSPSGDLDFSTYVVFRSETGVVTTNDVVVGAVDSVDETFLDDDGLVDNTAYYYRVFTFDEGGLLTPSNVVSALTKNEPPPGVQLTVTDSDSVSATFEWTATSVHDFDLYRLYRNTNSAVTTGSTLVAEINDADVTTFRDLELSTGTEYFYRLFVVDDGVDPGPEATGSNTVSVLPAAVFRKPGGTRAHDISETR